MTKPPADSSPIVMHVVGDGHDSPFEAASPAGIGDDDHLVPASFELSR
jgi:hypothetical protein